MADDTDFDPEDLEPVQKIRYAADLVREEHRVLADDYLFWGHLAGYFSRAACIPEKTENTSADWREFNRAQDMATGYIQMVKRLRQLKENSSENAKGRSSRV